MSTNVSKTIRSFLIGAAGSVLTFAGMWAAGQDPNSIVFLLLPLINTAIDYLRRQIPVESVSGNK